MFFKSCYSPIQLFICFHPWHDFHMRVLSRHSKYFVMWVKPSLRLVCAIPHIPQRRHLQVHKGSLAWVIRLPHSCKRPLMTEWCGMEGPCAFHMATSKKHKHSRQAPILPWNSPHEMRIMHWTAQIQSHDLQTGAHTMMLSCSGPLVITHINPEYSSIKAGWLLFRLQELSTKSKLSETSPKRQTLRWKKFKFCPCYCVSWNWIYKKIKIRRAKNTRDIYFNKIEKAENSEHEAHSMR